MSFLPRSIPAANLRRILPALVFAAQSPLPEPQKCRIQPERYALYLFEKHRIETLLTKTELYTIL
jgi:hypothetical protein